MKNTSWLLLFALAASLSASDVASANDDKVLVYGATGRVGSRVVSEASNRGKSRISMEDLALALVDEIENTQHIGRRMSVAY